jgi:hypothetical protein
MSDKVDYWLALCDENVKSAKILLKGKQYLDAGFSAIRLLKKR